MKNRNYILIALAFIILLIIYFSYVYFSHSAINNFIVNEKSININNQDKYIGAEEQTIIHNIVPNQKIKSPTAISGKARGTWFFEASFPVKLLDQYYNEITTTIAIAKSNWMTEDFVEFDAMLNFEKPNIQRGFIVFQKDNPSGLPENDEKIYVPIIFN